MSFNQNLQRLRGAKKQKETALNIGIPYANYNKYETTNTMPDAETLFKIADYYRISVDELLGHEVPYVLNRVQFSDKQLEVIESIKDLTDEDCRYLLASIYAIKSANQEKENTIKKFKN